MYLAKGTFRSCELDTYEDGCQPNTGYAIDWDISFQGESIENVLEQIKEFHSVDDDALEIEDGKIDVQLHEVELYDRWVTPSKEHIKAWKKGEQDIYLCDYSYKLYREV